MTRPPVALVCLPFAGAGASFFRPWAAYAPAGLRVLPVQLPGRERLVDEPPYTDVRAAVAGVLPGLRAELAAAGLSRVIPFGHSLGALLAYELARALLEDPGTEVVRLVVSGSPEPAAGRAERASGLPDGEFLARVEAFAGYSSEVLADPEARELILPVLRADVLMHEDYRPDGASSLPVPVTSVRGADDALVGPDDAAGWAKVTGRDFDLLELPGGHMYLIDAVPALLSAIAAGPR